MTVPKFRAWFHHEMKTPTTMEFNDHGDLDYICFDFDDVGVHPDHVDLMQSTGLYDKNGAEVFEGDICCDEGSFGYDWWTYGFVKWDKDELRWEVEWPAEAITEPLGGYSYNFGYGNIYENPCLMEGNK